MVMCETFDSNAATAYGPGSLCFLYKSEILSENCISHIPVLEVQTVQHKSSVHKFEKY